MAREISRFRLVFTGISKGPTKTWSEYQVVDGDLKEKAKHKVYKGVDFGKTLGGLWAEKLESVKEEEKINE